MQYLDLFFLKCYKPYFRFCKRIHFFEEINEDEINNVFIEPYNENLVMNIQNKYLGFIVVKPLPQTVIGRTVLKVIMNNTEDTEYSPKFYCLKKYHSNLYGLDLYIDSLAFQEQDTVTAACATSALWSALQKVTQIFHYYSPTPSEITSYATKYMQFTRAIPSPGLTIEQICQAITEMGLEPDIREYINPKNESDIKLPLLSFIYSYLRSGLPIVLGMNMEGILHTSTLVGYQIAQSPVIENELGCIDETYSTLKFKGSNIKKLFAHDDQIGPFSEMKVELDADGKSIFLRSNTLENGGTPIPIKPTEVIIPLYHKIRVPMLALLPHIFSVVKLVNSLEILPYLDSDIEWDMYLTCVNEFKKEFFIDENQSCIDKNEVLFDDYPRFFWRSIAFNKEIKLFELLGDATDMERSCQVFKIIFYDKKFMDGFISSLRKDDVFSNLDQILCKPLIATLYEEIDRY